MQVINPGNYDLSWLIDQGEDQNAIRNSQYLTMQEIQEAVNSRNNVD